MGQIASGYGSPEEVAPYCHTGGLLQSHKLQLAAVADPFPTAHEAFEEKWSTSLVKSSSPVNHYESAINMLESEELDIVGICVRGPMHFETVRSVLLASRPPKAIFLEKPAFCSLQETDEIVALAREKGVSITLSYSRHWAPHVLKLQELVSGGLIGKVNHVIGYCGGAVLSFASHTTDLICQFACAQDEAYTVNAVTAVTSIEQEIPADFINRGYEPEPSLRGALIEFANGAVGTQIGGEGAYGSCYADVFGDNGRVRVGMYLEPQAWDSQGQAIELSSYEFPADTSVFHLAYDQIADYLSGGALPHCTDSDWHQVNEIGFAMIESSLGFGRTIIPNINRTRQIFANG